MQPLKPRQKYVRLSEGPILVLPKQQVLVAEYSQKRGVSINQTVRDIIDFAELYGFFNGNGISNGNVSTPTGEQ